MREAIRNLLVVGVPEAKGHIYEPHVPEHKTPKPYIVLREGVQDAETDWSAFSTIVEVWPYAKRTTFANLDTLVSQTINTLHRARFIAGSEHYLIDYLGSVGEDIVDTEWDAITRGLRFKVFALGWLNGITFDPDPVAALRSWTAGQWPDVYTDPVAWNPTDLAPAIYWRITTMTPVRTTAAVTWFDAQISAHILAPSVGVRLRWVRTVTEAIARQREACLSDNSPLFFIKVAADSEADPMRRGQIQLTAQFGVLQAKPLTPKLKRAVISGDINGEVVRDG